MHILEAPITWYIKIVSSIFLDYQNYYHLVFVHFHDLNSYFFCSSIDFFNIFFTVCYYKIGKVFSVFSAGKVLFAFTFNFNSLKILHAIFNNFFIYATYLVNVWIIKYMFSKGIVTIHSRINF